MVKIVGKIFIICCSVMSLYIDARIYMEVRTENDTQNRVVVGQPFTLDVVIDDVYGSIPSPTIKGLDKFPHRQSGSYMSSVNGKAMIRYSYQVSIDAIGSYVLGPATVMYQQQELVSNQVHVEVVKDVGTQQQSKNNKSADSKIFLRFMVDNESVVVGQKIGCILRFYYQDPSISLANVGTPELSAFDVKETSQLEHGVAEIDDVQYKYVQWRWDMYPTKPGDFVIPAYNADYEIPSKDNHFLAGFLMLMNRAERKRVYSNALTLKVAALPYCDFPVHAVGVFERFSAEIKPGMAKEGEGMVLTMDIEGDGNLQAIATPSLNVPSALKYYDSQHNILTPKYSDELPKKRFEFIVQGMKAGDCEIPEQLFTYFDIQTHKYVTLRTTPLAISIMPGAVVAKTAQKTDTSFEPEKIQVATQELIGDINTVGEWYPVSERTSLPWWLFQLLFLIPCMYVGCPLMIEKGIMVTGNSARLARRRAFRNAYKSIDTAIKHNQSKDLYAIFMNVFTTINKDYRAAETLITQKLSASDTHAWKEFFENITHAAYAQSDFLNNNELCRMAKQWLERLEKIL
ncbi:MAG TPA: BatD family protein [Candidatus Babeliales bacterium]|nr:BatD family protein [Candidatus Babeliales bacterium]